MKIIEAITNIDSLNKNSYSQTDKLRWLSRLDTMAKKQVIDTHEGGDDVVFTGYDDGTDLHTELLIPEPFDEVYRLWMDAQIYYANGEYGKYNNAIEMFNTEWQAYQNHYNRTHMPKGKSMKFF